MIVLQKLSYAGTKLPWDLIIPEVELILQIYLQTQ